FFGKVAIGVEREKTLREAERTLLEVAKALGVDPNQAKDDIAHLIRIRLLATTGPAESALLAAKREIEALSAARKALEDALKVQKRSGTEGMVKEIERLARELATKEGQLTRAEGLLKKFGQGAGERPCWVKPDGSIEFLYDVVLTSKGIRMREYLIEGRA